MSPLWPSSSTRWVVLCAVVLVSFYVWRQPFASTPEPPSGYIPQKLYEPDAALCNDHAANEAPTPPENLKAPLFPSFKSSAKTLPPDLYDPYPEYNSRTWQKKWKGIHVPCMGPRGLEVNGNPADILMAHRLQSQPYKPMFGSYNFTGLESDFCFDRHARYDPYGYDEDDLEDDPAYQADNNKASKPNARVPKVLWDKVNWGLLQGDCLSRNQDRYEPFESTNRTTLWKPTQQDFEEVDNVLIFPTDNSMNGASYRLWNSNRKSYKERSAIVFRTEDTNEWTIDTMQYVRSMIMELSLHSGAEYEIIFLVEVKDDKLAIFEDSQVYRETMLKSVPNEFGNNTVLFNRDLLKTWYSKSGVQDAKSSKTSLTSQPLQLLSLLRPDIANFWQVELDVRYTGHHYHHLETVSAWAKAQPRKLLWERASRYYVQSIHGSWANFSSVIANQTVSGGIWGAERTTGIEPIGPEPPTESSENDNYEWGVGEEADLINLAPVFNPVGSSFLHKDSVDHYTDGKKTPRRATGTSQMIRMSKRLLRAMHHGQVALGSHMAPEMFPYSTALHHGLKLVVFPLPVYLDYAKTPKDMNRIFNHDEGKSLLNSPYKYEDIWRRMSYWSTLDSQTNYPDELYKRWLGYSGDPTERLCLPGLLLHPIKGV